MSIIVKGMEMPKNCIECRFRQYEYCDLQRQDLYAVNIMDYALSLERHPSCPLIEIPTPHGRLGDLDELWDRMYNYIDNEGAKMPYGDNDFMIHRDSACELIEDAPTVIEAEGRGE